MKKIIYSLFLFLLFPTISLAVSYDIEGYYINAEVLENGDVSVEEIFLVDGTMNGYELNLSTSSSNSTVSASAISNVSVAGANIDSISFDTFEENFTDFTLVSFANIGDSQKYTVDNTYNGVSIRMYYPINNEKIAFKVSYTLEDAIILHNGFAEFYWNFFSGELQDEINDLNVRVVLPGVDNSEYFRFWAHGPLSGEVHDYNSNTNNIVIASIDKLEAYGILDMRITFDDSLVNTNLISKHSDETLDDIVAEETEIASETNALRREVQTKWNIALFGTIGFYILLVIGFVYVYLKYDKELKSDFNHKYNRDFIDDYNVEVVDYLMNHNVTENALSASVMNLIYKKNIKAEAIPDKKDSYTFTLLNRDNLNDAENSLVDFLFTTVGNGNTFTTMALKKYASNATTCRDFMSSYTNWKNKVIIDGKSQNFFEKKRNYVWIPFVLLIYSIILLTFISSNNIEMFFGILTIFFAIIFMIYAIACTKKTKKGIEHYAKWKAFKNFLNDFGNFSIKELPEIALWERYLVYATVFGLADKVEKAMNVKITEFDNVDSADYIMFTHIHNMHMASIISSSMHSAINSSQVSINRANASSSMSSGGGFGGGFSGGGGFGGGGRSGGGF
ncbi:MAG TPA: DUF2207 domain-containing protein [Candidatus Onthocola stercorigallinarum]|nr:DUF2207 domain-containing protein [Candidatus Onthocola stercorigallinarum]